MYLTNAPDGKRARLLGFDHITLKPNESRKVNIDIDRRLLGHFDNTQKKWHLAAGQYNIAVGKASDDLELNAQLEQKEQYFGQ